MELSTSPEFISEQLSALILFQIFSNVTLLIDTETIVGSRTFLKKPGTKLNEQGSYLEVCGTFKDIHDVFLELPRKEGKKGEYGAPKERSSEYEHSSVSIKSASSARVEPVKVDSIIMSYIEEKCCVELNKIGRPQISMQGNKQQVTFHPGDTKHGAVLAQLARERFITFYQKIATGLQTRPYALDAAQLQPLLAKFPELLIRKTDEITLTGKCVSLDRFEQFLISPPKRSSSRQINYTMDMSTAGSSKASQNETVDKEENCSICLEQMVKSQMKTLEKCRHSFCRDCLKRAFAIKPVCPTCGVLYGALKGTQPKDSKMKVTYDKFPLPGYENYETIIIHYIIPDGVQKVSNANDSFLLQ